LTRGTRKLYSIKPTCIQWMQFDCSNKTSVVQNNVLLLLLNTERLQLVSDYDLFITLCLEALLCMVPRAHDIFYYYHWSMHDFSAKHATFRRKGKHWLTQNRNKVTKWDDMSTRGLFFQWASTIDIPLSLLV
jgi:hypothetical protein